VADPKDLELLILSRYAIIAVETYEEERVEATVQAVATKLQIPFFVWTLTEGLRRRGAESPIYDTQRPIMALANLAAIKGDGVYLFKDLHRHLGDPEVVRKLQDLARPFGQARRAIVLSAPRIELPPELEKLAASFRLELPTRDELARLAADVVAQLGRQHRVRMELSPAEFDRLVDATRGFTLYEAERALTRVVLEHQEDRRAPTSSRTTPPAMATTPRMGGSGIVFSFSTSALSGPRSMIFSRVVYVIPW